MFLSQTAQHAGDPEYAAIRKITPAGVVSTSQAFLTVTVTHCALFADGTGSDARFYYPSTLALDSANNIYVADKQNHAIRKVTPAGVVTTLAGDKSAAGWGVYSEGYVDGPGSTAQFSFPSGVAVDSAGNIYIADTGNNVIRKISPTATVSTFAGLAGNPGSLDGTGNGARFSSPTGVALDAAANLYVADAETTPFGKSPRPR